MKNKFTAMLAAIKAEAPLIHCITNPVTMNDCANILLSLGARPIMAEHPREVAEIVSIAKALTLNLGTISDAQMSAMVVASKAAKEHGVPICIDLVGVACSTLRLDYARKLISEYTPDVIKGNISELRALFGLPITPGMGVEAGAKEMVTQENAPEYIKIFREKAKEYHAALLATGAVDLAVSENAAYTMSNGTAALTSITGTGCMTNVLTGACLAATKAVKDDVKAEAVDAAVMACVLMGLSGERSHQTYVNRGPGSFRVQLMDSMHALTATDIVNGARIDKF